MSKKQVKGLTGESVEESLDRLGVIVEKLESEETTLEEAINLYQEGHKLANSCRKQLSAAELVVTNLVSDENEES